MKPEIAYTCGFIFDDKLERVLLLRKRRGPEFNVGKWNGIGGKIEQGEGIRQCMVRECEEECGLQTCCSDWSTFHTEAHLAEQEQLNPRIYFMTARLLDDVFDTFSSKTDETVMAFRIYNELGYDRVTNLFYEGVYNLRYLVPMALCWHRHPERRWLEG